MRPRSQQLGQGLKVGLVDYNPCTASWAKANRQTFTPNFHISLGNQLETAKVTNVTSNFLRSIESFVSLL